MVDRRKVLTLGVAAVAGALVNAPGIGAGAAAIRRGYALCRGIFDERFEDGVAFARELDRSGVVTTALRGDVAGLWYGDLRARLQRRPAPLAGLTDRAALFCLEELARDVERKSRL